MAADPVALAGPVAKACARACPLPLSIVGPFILDNSGTFGFDATPDKSTGLLLWSYSLRLVVIWWVAIFITIEPVLQAGQHLIRIHSTPELRPGSDVDGRVVRFERFVAAQLGLGGASIAATKWLAKYEPIEFLGIAVGVLFLGIYSYLRVHRDRIKRDLDWKRLVPEPEPDMSHYEFRVAWTECFGVRGKLGVPRVILLALTFMASLASASFIRHNGDEQWTVFASQVRREPIDAPEVQTSTTTTEPLTDESASATTVLVRPGDSFWMIAVRNCQAEEIGDEFLVCFEAWIETNYDKIQDPDDPDLIQPGQEFVPPTIEP